MSKRPRRDDRERAELRHRYEGPETLLGLLEIAGSELSVEDVAERMAAAISSGESPSSLFPSLFAEEPRFPGPDVARQLFENLFGLWDLVSDGKSWRGPAKPRPKPPKVEPPAPFAPGEPSADFVEAAWRYLEACPARERNRLFDAFENREDALLQWLDEQQLPDEGYGQARLLLFELYAMLTLGWPKGMTSAEPVSLEEAQAPAAIPSALLAYSDEALFEAEQDEQAPLSAAQTGRVRSVVRRALAGLWRARR